MTATLEFPIGADYSAELTFEADLTGCLVLFTAKKSVKDSDDDAVILATISEHADAANGKTLLDISNSDTAKLEAGKNYVGDFRLVDSAGKVTAFPLMNIVGLLGATTRTE